MVINITTTLDTASRMQLEDETNEGKLMRQHMAAAHSSLKSAYSVINGQSAQRPVNATQTLQKMQRLHEEAEMASDSSDDDDASSMLKSPSALAHKPLPDMKAGMPAAAGVEPVPLLTKVRLPRSAASGVVCVRCRVPAGRSVHWRAHVAPAMFSWRVGPDNRLLGCQRTFDLNYAGGV